MSELKPCPFCGCVDIFRGYDDNGETCVLYIYCGRCNCQTTVFDNEESCVQAWNTRAPQWQPIETAPKTGEQVLTFRHKLNGITIGGFTENWYQTSFWSNQHKVFVGFPKEIQPTHWMPLPEAPNVK